MDEIIALIFLVLGLAAFAALWTFSTVLTLRREMTELRAEVRSLGRKRDKILAQSEEGTEPPAPVPRGTSATGVEKSAGAADQGKGPPSEVPSGSAAPGAAAESRPTALYPAQAPRSTPAPARSLIPSPVPSASPSTKPQLASVARAPGSTTEPPFDWERLLGVRGAAIVGGIALVLAGIFFVQVAIDRGWLGPAARDLLAFAIGVCGIGLHGPLRRRGMAALADSLGGAGTVLIYGASWAAAQLHGLVSTPLAFAVMTATTGMALFLAVRTNAPIVAAFALIGGFATPLLLETVQSDSIGILGYVLVLNGVLLAFGRVRRWSWAWPLAAIGASAVQLTWAFQLVKNQAEPNAWLACAAVGAVVAAFLVSPPPQDSPASTKHRSNGPTRASAPTDVVRILCALSYGVTILTALVCGGLVANLGTPGPSSLWQVALLAAMLLTTSAVADKGIKATLFFPSSSVAAVVLTVVVLGGSSNLGEPGAAFQTWAAVSACLGAVIAALCLAIKRGAPALAYGLTGLLLLRIATFAGRVEDTAAFTPALALFAILALFGASRGKGSGAWGACTGILCGIVLCFQIAGVMGPSLDTASPLPWTAAALSVAAALLGLILRSDAPLRKALTGFALWAPLVILVLVSESKADLAALQIAAGAVAAAGLAAALSGYVRSSAGQRSPSETTQSAVGSAAITAAASAAVLWSWSLDADAAAILGAPWAHAIAAAVLVMAPLAAIVCIAPRLRPRRQWLAWAAGLPAAAVAVGPAAFQAEYAAGSVAGWHVTLAIAALALLIAAGTLHVRSASAGQRSARSFPMVMTLSGLAAAVFALSASRAFAAQWHLVAASLSAGSIAYFTLRARSQGPGAAAAILLAFTAVLLVGLTFLGRAFLAEPFFLPIELSIDYGMTALGVLLAYAGSRRLRKTSELRGHVARATLALLLVLAFAWVNAAVLNRFTDGGHIRIEPERMQHRDLAISISWTAFAALTLGAGMWRRNLALRWTSLGLLVATIFKVFLYDLGALEGLSRVGSFLGLSVALLGVSIAYSRLLRSTEPAPASAPKAN